MYNIFFFVHRLDGKKVFIENVPITNMNLIKSMFDTYNESKRFGMILGYQATLAYCPVEPLFLF